MPITKLNPFARFMCVTSLAAILRSLGANACEEKTKRPRVFYWRGIQISAGSFPKDRSKSPQSFVGMLFIAAPPSLA